MLKVPNYLGTYVCERAKKFLDEEFSLYQGVIYIHVLYLTHNSFGIKQQLKEILS